jgi:hypothetical protein
MRALTRIALAFAYLCAAAFPCVEPGTAAPPPSLARAYVAEALHTHGAPPERPAGELRAPCACGCDEAPLTALGSTPLGAALLPTQPMLALPRANHAASAPLHDCLAPGRLPDPVPRSA